MVYSRMTAAITVFLLIAVVTLACIGMMQGVGTVLEHEGNMEHSAGTITLDADHSFTLTTANHEHEHFQCSKRCLVEWSHMQRHQNEKAHTDVYYIRDVNNVLVALDVD